ncbi:uncharacterized protein LOC130223449 [Danio aesculapii]|uniref:uncharacterized protein LOC130223449 n=1 Tax=Danio aesculapii TaxID=1142201 RepID=UPI0024BFED8D|nr:uncharacterized protein LOC130223449 [Danio aesculapii]
MVIPVMTTAANLTDPCNNYTVLSDSWRSVNNTNNTNVCDWYISWSGWYRLFINGLNAHIPDTCVAVSRCGTSFPLWIHGGHPTVRDGVVTRDVCANAYGYCCFFPSYPIRVKACPGNYYVYELLKPTVCNSAYCADVGSVIISSTAATPLIITPDPCYNYTVLDDPWRADSSQPLKSVYICDQSVSWSGWYRLIINGLSAQIPDTCVEMYSCGTHVPLWIRGGHPTVEDGVVTRDVCGHWYNYCCHFGSFPIRVKACPGNYYVYELLSPTTCFLAYCAVYVFSLVWTESSSSWVLITAGITGAVFVMFVILMVFMLIRRKRVTPSEEQNPKGSQPQHSVTTQVESPEDPYMTIDPKSTCSEYNTLDIMKRSCENTKSSEGQDPDYYSIVN